MRKRDDYFKEKGRVYLNRKEKIMLNMLLKNGRAFNTAIAKRLKISSQVTGRIRKELEKKEIIKDYSIELDHHLMGIHVFTLVLLDVEVGYEEKLMSKNLISFYKVLSDSVTHIALYAFRNLEESNNYFHSLVEHSENIKIVSTDVFPIESLIKHSPKNLFYNAIRGFDGVGIFNVQPMSFNNLKRKKKKLKNLTNSEKSVLKALIKNSRISCKKISSNLNIKITRASVNRTKNRLENKNLIKGYNVNLDYEKLGINILAFIFVSRKSEFLKHKEALIKLCHNSPDVICCYRLNKETAIFCGFKDLNDLENYCDIMRSKGKDYIKIKHIHIILPKGTLKESFTDLYLSLLN